MKTTLLIIALFAATLGCGKPHQATVYGRSGAAYQAPALCEALVKCLNSTTESECIYESYRYSTAAGGDVDDVCKGVKK